MQQTQCLYLWSHMRKAKSSPQFGSRSENYYWFWSWQMSNEYWIWTCSTAHNSKNIVVIRMYRCCIFRCLRTRANVLLKMEKLLIWIPGQKAREHHVNSTLIWRKTNVRGFLELNIDRRIFDNLTASPYWCLFTQTMNLVLDFMTPLELIVTICNQYL